MADTKTKVEETKPVTEVKKEEKPVVIKRSYTTIESADGRSLYVGLNGVVFEGKSITVPAELESEVRRLLTQGNFLIR